ncbi:Glyoxalase-like domain protein [Rubripirellula obstinata]|uniref:Glyoxalase-like domain protein n=1 Tax=Rubripirellula obstinata TaxID=406547 RepID=A0A5B1CF53_9BACT|nr:VOC family protein [Rubripirellula obstinata]KAA1257954.1 Glyoxalase-like domain protein [Rubripirellula obstinata]
MKLGYIILYVPNVEEAVAFYETAFGLECRFFHESGDYAEMKTGETALAFASEELADSHFFAYRKTTADQDAPSVEVAFVTDDVQAGFDKAVAAGAFSAKPPTTQPWGQVVCYVRDVNGYLVEICSPVGG